jgi:hypothetical protein
MILTSNKDQARVFYNKNTCLSGQEAGYQFPEFNDRNFPNALSDDFLREKTF